MKKERQRQLRFKTKLIYTDADRNGKYTLMKGKLNGCYSQIFWYKKIDQTFTAIIHYLPIVSIIWAFAVNINKNQLPYSFQINFIINRELKEVFV